MSYIGVDLDKCAIMFKVPDMHTAALLSGTRYLDTTHFIFPVERQTAVEAKYRVRTLPKLLCGYEQQRIYKSITGEDWVGTYGALMDKLHEMLVDLPMTDINLFDLEREVGSDPLAADSMELQKRPVYQPVSVSVKSAPGPAIPSAPGAPAAASDDAPWLSAAPKAPSAPTPPPAPMPSAPKPPSAPSIPSAPKTGSTTGRVWAIAEHHLQELQIESMTPDELVGNKEFRRQVIALCETQGINPGTAATQFGAWKRSKGL